MISKAHRNEQSLKGINDPYQHIPPLSPSFSLSHTRARTHTDTRTQSKIESVTFQYIFPGYFEKKLYQIMEEIKLLLLSNNFL